VRCRIRKNAARPDDASAAVPAARRRKTLVVFSGDLDRVLAALVIANGALAMGDQVTLFFTFWGLCALRREKLDGPAPSKGPLDRMFGWMLPRGLNRLTLSRLNMAGMGTAMMKRVMASKQVDPPQALLAKARAQGVRLVACSMSMDVMGLKPEELIDGVEIGGVASFLAEADRSSATLFV
jgi:tRNA 2-thiouridine synthesizing protein A